MTQPNLKTETIFALASAPGRAGVAIMRVSGPQSGRVISALTKAALPAPRKAALRNLYDGGGDQIDQALVLRFAGPARFTGEDMDEFHIHGAPIAASALAEALFALGLRQAGPGEFTRRAFENGKLDLTEAEGLADLIDADTDGQRRQALRQMQGGLRDVYEGWRSRILDALLLTAQMGCVSPESGHQRGRLWPMLCAAAARPPAAAPPKTWWRPTGLKHFLC